MKRLLLIAGALASVLLVSQLVMGLLLAQGQVKLRVAHQHTGILTVVVTLVYIGGSMAVIASRRNTPKP